MKKIASVLILAGAVMAGSAFSPVMLDAIAEDKAAAQAVDVGNKICPVSGEKIDAASGMAPAVYEYNGKIYNFCCPGCISTFKADPEKYGKVAEDEVAAQQVK